MAIFVKRERERGNQQAHGKGKESLNLQMNPLTVLVTFQTWFSIHWTGTSHFPCFHRESGLWAPVTTTHPASADGSRTPALTQSDCTWQGTEIQVHERIRARSQVYTFLMFCRVGYFHPSLTVGRNEQTWIKHVKLEWDYIFPGHGAKIQKEGLQKKKGEEKGA